MTRHLAMVIFPGFQLLDAAGPITAFEVAERFSPGAYSMEVVAQEPGPVASSSGVSFEAEPLGDGPYDTVIVAGGEGTRAFGALVPTTAWLQRQFQQVRRMTSVCSGAYLLAEAGLLEQRRCTTHWALSDQFARRFPQARLQPDRIFVRDGSVWTSAGITAGIDLALALIEEDLGLEIARRTAQQLVVHQRRPGGQSQFSALLDAGGATGRFAELTDWIRNNLSEPLTVEQLAEQACMSPRNFARAFVSETGTTPAKAVERLRLDAARTLVEAGGEPIDRVALTTGFGDPERMRRAFLRAFGQPPQALRRMARA
ncbi:GlxA family transcriptional regulator [Phenylobacterium deserti]|uniref:GlxA family transcriptional regulator n=1 Tax=Phenylobacterium deserti TaxID=1914756 RepID=A0A328AA55_9CAUL|nr:GlxA family transcriptional regulator [Phenylobacterium deserti]RAK51429.1 GlxA family transcriptional regulator [Phenylobacterium deserti]